MLAKKSIFGPTVVRAKDCFQKLRLEITDGYELIGLYPYKNDRKANMFLEDINICPEYASISLNTSLGELSCFKVTDFERTVIQDTFDFWFGHYDRLGVVGDAYHRLLLSHDNGDLQTGS